MKKAIIRVWLVGGEAPIEVQATNIYAGQFWLEFKLEPSKIAHAVFNRDQVQSFHVIESDQ
jgi:hypothetical protein